MNMVKKITMFTIDLSLITKNTYKQYNGGYNNGNKNSCS